MEKMTKKKNVKNYGTECYDICSRSDVNRKNRNKPLATKMDYL
jgi:hypothetical protein